MSDAYDRYITSNRYFEQQLNVNSELEKTATSVMATGGSVCRIGFFFRSGMIDSSAGLLAASCGLSKDYRTLSDRRNLRGTTRTD
jgi:hypothetical protein